MQRSPQPLHRLRRPRPGTGVLLQHTRTTKSARSRTSWTLPPARLKEPANCWKNTSGSRRGPPTNFSMAGLVLQDRSGAAKLVPLPHRCKHNHKVGRQPGDAPFKEFLVLLWPQQPAQGPRRQPPPPQRSRSLLPLPQTQTQMPPWLWQPVGSSKTPKPRPTQRLQLLLLLQLPQQQQTLTVRPEWLLLASAPVPRNLPRADARRPPALPLCRPAGRRFGRRHTKNTTIGTQRQTRQLGRSPSSKMPAGLQTTKKIPKPSNSDEGTLW
mmetsp:Transcript_33345/g.50419  ORF Transcript_33345/g.50419 Transcript_33345/m.50419 type:complete len:268 (+) Transcript_33345:210-1013(+)